MIVLRLACVAACSVLLAGCLDLFMYRDRRPELGLGWASDDLQIAQLATHESCWETWRLLLPRLQTAEDRAIFLAAQATRWGAFPPATLKTKTNAKTYKRFVFSLLVHGTLFERDFAIPYAHPPGTLREAVASLVAYAPDLTSEAACWRSEAPASECIRRTVAAGAAWTGADIRAEFSKSHADDWPRPACLIAPHGAPSLWHIVKD